MDGKDWFIRFVLPRSFSTISEIGQNGNTYLCFEPETSTLNDGLQSEILIGRIAYKNKKGNSNRSTSLLIKLFPSTFQRSTFTEVTFSNEMFVYAKILPFYKSLKDSIENLFPKFYFGNLTLANEENKEGCVVLENLKENGYRGSESKVFLDYQHLSLMMKKLGEFHAYSYMAKATNGERFQSLVNALMESSPFVLKMYPNFLQEIHKVYTELISKDARYADKAKKFKEIITDADEFCEGVFKTRNEPVAVLCHGDFLRNNVLFKYDSKMNPIDMKFIDVANMRYCTPVVDLGLVLYMNTTQETRDKYWHQLLDVYYESLQNTFPTVVVPTKNEILSQFKRNVLQPYLLAMFFLPAILEQEKLESGFWFDKIVAESEYKEYVGKPLSFVPIQIIVNIFKKIHKGENSKVVLDIIMDIINKDFV